MNPPEPETDELSAKLQAWRAEAQVPDSFQRHVWQQIAAQQAARDDAFWPRLAAQLGQLFSRPAFALVIVLVSLSGGIACGRVKANDANAHSWHDLEARYEMSLNPLAREVDHLSHLKP